MHSPGKEWDKHLVRRMVTQEASHTMHYIICSSCGIPTQNCTGEKKERSQMTSPWWLHMPSKLMCLWEEDDDGTYWNGSHTTTILFGYLDEPLSTSKKYSLRKGSGMNSVFVTVLLHSLQIALIASEFNCLTSSAICPKGITTCYSLQFSLIPQHTWCHLIWRVHGDCHLGLSACLAPWEGLSWEWSSFQFVYMVLSLQNSIWGESSGCSSMLFSCSG